MNIIWVTDVTTGTFTITLDTPPTATTPVVVTYDVMRTSALPAAKVIKKGRYVKIDTRSNPSGP